MEDLQKKLRAIQEGAILAENDGLDDDDDDIEEEEDVEEVEIDDDAELEELDDEDLDEELMSEVTLHIIESEIGPENMQAFLEENAAMLIRDGLLSESNFSKIAPPSQAALTGGGGGGPNKSYIVLSPQARRKKAINILKLRMAREAGDPRYKRLVVVRKLMKKLLFQIRSDGRYKKAEQIVRRQRFKVVHNPTAAAALKRAKTTKLS